MMHIVTKVTMKWLEKIPECYFCITSSAGAQLWPQSMPLCNSVLLSWPWAHVLSLCLTLTLSAMLITRNMPTLTYECFGKPCMDWEWKTCHKWNVSSDGEREILKRENIYGTFVLELLHPYPNSSMCWFIWSDWSSWILIFIDSTGARVN